LKLAYGEGLILAVLIPVVLLLVGLLAISLTVFLIFLLAGAWTIVSAFAFGKSSERMFYIAWGLVLASVASFFVLKLQYAVAILVLVVIASVLLNVASRGKGKDSKTMQKNQEGSTLSI
jgi:FtsH-binding integral membrane protein